MAGSVYDDDDMLETHDINVTPFIDVVLVLLIVFMIAAPLSTVDIPVQLPSTQAQPQKRPDDPLYLTLTENLEIRLGNDVVAREPLATERKRLDGPDKSQPVYLPADRRDEYRELCELINLMRSAGYLKVALVGQESA